MNSRTGCDGVSAPAVRLRKGYGSESLLDTFVHFFFGEMCCPYFAPKYWLHLVAYRERRWIGDTELHRQPIERGGLGSQAVQDAKAKAVEDRAGSSGYTSQLG